MVPPLIFLEHVARNSCSCRRQLAIEFPCAVRNILQMLFSTGISCDMLQENEWCYSVLIGQTGPICHHLHDVNFVEIIAYCTGMQQLKKCFNLQCLLWFRNTKLLVVWLMLVIVFKTFLCSLPMMAKSKFEIYQSSLSCLMRAKVDDPTSARKYCRTGKR